MTTPDTSDVAQLVAAIEAAPVRSLYRVLSRAGVGARDLGLTVAKYTDAPKAELVAAIRAQLLGGTTAAARRLLRTPPDLYASAPDAPGDALGAALAAVADELLSRAAIDERLAAAVASLPPRDVRIVRDDAPAVTVPGPHHAHFPALLSALSAGLNVWLAGPKGAGKSWAAQAAATALGVPLVEVPPVESAAQLVGFESVNEYRHGPIRDAWRDGGVISFEELAGSEPRALLALFNALASGWLALPNGERIQRSDKTYVIACDNTTGHGGGAQFAGRTRQDTAFLDRFVTLRWDYDPALESAILPPSWLGVLRAGRKYAAERNADRLACSPRAALMAAKLHGRDGWPLPLVIETCWRGGMDATSWEPAAQVLRDAAAAGGLV